MKLFPLALVMLGLIFLSSNARAEQCNHAPKLTAQREQIMQQYVMALGKADYRKISALFKKGGIVISTSRGNVDAKEFFYAFLPKIASSSSEFHQAFLSNADNNRYAARFNFKYQLKAGESGDGEYIDEFIFDDNSKKLSEVYMFENLKFQQKN